MFSIARPVNIYRKLSVGKVFPSVISGGVIEKLWTEQTKLLTTTADFDAGTKSNSSGNYEVETITDNGANDANALILGNLNGDMFNFSDADALTWKWKDGPGSTSVTARDIDITVNDALYMKETMTTTALSAHNQTTDTLAGDFDVRINCNVTWENGNQYVHFRFYISDLDVFYITMRKSAVGAYTMIGTTIINGSAVSTTRSSITDYDVSFRLTRTGTSVTMEYDDAGGDNWTVLKTQAGFSESAGTVSVGIYHGVNAGSTTAVYKNFRCDVATWTATGYRTSGNWTSEEYEIPNAGRMKNISINLSDGNENRAVEKVELLDGDDNILTTATGDIYETGDNTVTGWDTALSSITGIVKVKIYLKGDGGGSVAIQSVSIVSEY